MTQARRSAWALEPSSAPATDARVTVERAAALANDYINKALLSARRPNAAVAAAQRTTAPDEGGAATATAATPKAHRRLLFEARPADSVPS
ncbi:hypothetical protein AB1Y20_005096 [Prymnesium parvum]|uniref:Uncharacterized protein n=1 Tax=Prymnesium parvum TaxID=97485 RepID=A0AB34J4X0_PRYPA